MSQSIFNLTDRVIIITGGLGQLGRQYTKTLLEYHAKVAVLDLPSEPPEGVLDIENNKGRLIYCSTNITNKDSIVESMAFLEDRLGVPYGLVNNAALDSPPNSPAEENGPFETYPLDSWNKVMAVNATGVFLACQVIGGAMAAAGRGSIINVSSTYGIVSPDQRLYKYRNTEGASFFKPVAYSASKSSLINLTRYLSTYWADKGVRVNNLVLGGVFNHQDEKFLKEYCFKVPLGRMAREDEYNGAVIFLLSDAASYMTGSNMVIDGGWTAW